MEMKTEDDQVMYVKQEPEVFLDKEDGETSICSGGYNDGGGGVVAVKGCMRKRPAKLDIPVVSMDMDIKERRSGMGVVEEEGDGYAVSPKRGRRETIEDRYSALIHLKGETLTKQALFGVFDGHGGTKAAEFAAANLDKNIMDQLDKRGDDEIGVFV